MHHAQWSFAPSGSITFIRQILSESLHTVSADLKSPSCRLTFILCKKKRSFITAKNSSSPFLCPVTKFQLIFGSFKSPMIIVSPPLTSLFYILKSISVFLKNEWKHKKWGIIKGQGTQAPEWQKCFCVSRHLELCNWIKRFTHVWPHAGGVQNTTEIFSLYSFFMNSPLASHVPSYVFLHQPGLHKHKPEEDTSRLAQEECLQAPDWLGAGLK